MRSGLRRDRVVRLVRQEAGQVLPILLRKGDAAGEAGRPPPTEVRRGSPSSVATAEIASVGNALESWQDLQAQVKTVLRILGSR